MDNVSLKTVEELLELAICLFRMTVRISKKLPVPKKRTTVIFIKVKSCNALLSVLLI